MHVAFDESGKMVNPGDDEDSEFEELIPIQRNNRAEE